MKVAINGFGRIGRLVLRSFFESICSRNFEIVGINDLFPIDSAIYLLKHDSVHGKFNAHIEKKSENEISISGKTIKYISERSPEALPWRELSVDIVLECTGIFKSKSACLSHINAGAKRVLVSCPVVDADKTIVFGVNDDAIIPQTDVILSNASCTTNCLAPVLMAIHKEIGIVNGFVTTVHSYTGDQRIMDIYHSDPRRSRAAAVNMIPTSTGATKAIEQIFPELSGKLSGLSVRVPTPNVSMIDFTFTSSRKISIDDINGAIEKYADSKLKEVLGYTREPLVSSDFNNCSLSSVADLSLTKVVDGTLGHVVSWYDNEWAFATRMLDVSNCIFNKLRG